MAAVHPFGDRQRLHRGPGRERTTVPLTGTEVFGVTSDLAVFSFIIAFGVTKALTNLAARSLTPAEGIILRTVFARTT